MGPQAEELLAAGVAAIGGKTEEALYVNQKPVLDAPSRDALEIEIPAPRAMSVPRKRERHAAGMKAEIARVASPGAARAPCRRNR